MPQNTWNHNIHYHGLVLRSVTPNCQRALDVGCGEGWLTRKLATCCQEVVGIDLQRAGAAASDFIQGDVMTYPFPEASFDFISAVATLHHLALLLALQRFAVC